MDLENRQANTRKLAEGLARMAADAGATPETCSDLHGAIIELDRHSGVWNWRALTALDGRLARLSRQVPAKVASAIERLRPITRDRSAPVLLSYLLFLLLFTPVAGYLLVLLLRHGANNNRLDSPEFIDGVRTVVSLVLWLPLFLANKINKTLRIPSVKPIFLPGLLLLALAATIEYDVTSFYFLSPDDFSWSAFWAYASTSARTRWLYPFPLVVITLNVLMASRFIRFTEEASEFLGSEIGSYAKFLLTAIGAIAISVLIRLGFVYFAPPLEQETAADSKPFPVVATTDRLNLRTCPGTVDCSVLWTLPRGTQLHVLDQEGEWLRVRLLEDEDLSGWVNAPYTERVE